MDLAYFLTRRRGVAAIAGEESASRLIEGKVLEELGSKSTRIGLRDEVWRL